MSISFDEIPSALRVPFVYAEFNSDNATSDFGLMPLRTLVCGQKLSTGTQAALTPVRVTSAAQAATLFGAGSMLAQMCAAYLKNDPMTDMRAIAVADASSGVAAQGTLQLDGKPTESGGVYFYVGGRKIRVAITANASATAISQAITAAFNAVPDCPIIATEHVVTQGSGGAQTVEVKLACRHKGEAGNGIDLRLGYYGESLPAGMTATITAMHGGSGNPEVDDLIAAMGDTQYHVIAWPWTDASSLHEIEAELADRWSALKRIEGVALCAAKGSYGTLATLGESRNSKHVCLMEAHDSIDTAWEYAARVAANAAYYGGIDPARPFQTLELKGALPVPEAERFTMAERNLLLFDGVSTSKVDAGGVVRIERLITTYRTSASGAADTAYLDVNTPMTLSLLRYSFVNYILRKYPRHKLADDGTNFGPGQRIITPKVGKAEAITWARAMEARGLMENIDDFATQIICERNLDDRNRLDWYLPPDLVNQFVVGAAQIGFIL